MKTIIGILCLLVSGLRAFALTTNVPCDFLSISNAALHGGLNNGDTVNIAAGTCVMTNQLTITKGIIIAGAGIGQTVLIDNTNSLFLGRLAFTTFGNNIPVVHDLTVVGNTNSLNLSGFFTFGKSTETNAFFHVYNVDFTNIWKRGGSSLGDIGGCLDHCTFEAAQGVVGSSATGWSPFGDGSNSWQRPLVYGTSNGVVYLENCVFNWPDGYHGANGMNDAYDGARWCIRFCQVTNTWSGGHGLDSGGLQSPVSFELYGNTFYSDAIANIANFGQWRGGTGLMYSNTCIAAGISTATGFYLTCYRAELNAQPPTIYNPATQTVDWGWVGTNNPIDGNSNIYGWPACQQIGYAPPITYNGTNTSMVSSPVYSWSNTYNGTNMGCIVENYAGPTLYNTNHPNIDDMIQPGRDFFNDTVAPGYTALVYPHPLDGYPYQGSPATGPTQCCHP